MVNVLAALAGLAAIGLLFALDPGGAIAESGFPDFRDMDWKQLTAWGFRLVGVGVALLLVLALWLKHRAPSQGIEAFRDSRYQATPRPGSMPAAAVSVLEHREVTARTLLASIIEMCQRGELRVKAAGTRSGYRYRLSQQGSPKFEWERLICDSLPTRPTTVQEMRDRMNDHSDAIGDRLGEYLQGRGLFHDNPVRFRKEHFTDGFGLATLSGVLMGVGSGFWTALWLTQWWANAIIGAVIGCAYWLIATPMNTGMLPPTQLGAYEIGQWLGLKESLAGPDPADARDESDPMFAYAVALDVAQPWLDVEASAPPWFGSGEAASLLGPDLDAAYHGFLHESAWGLAGRSEDAAEAAAETDDEIEAELHEMASLQSEEAERTEHRQIADEYGYQRYRVDEPVEKPRSGGRFRGRLMWVVILMGIGALVMVVLFSLDVVSPRAKPCPLDSPAIPTPAQIAVAGDLFRNECVRVRGTVVSQDSDELVLQVDRDEYVQRVNVRDPSEVLEAIPLGRVVTLAGWLKVKEDGTYEVHFVPDRANRGWWRNLRENFEGLF